MAYSYANLQLSTPGLQLCPSIAVHTHSCAHLAYSCASPLVMPGGGAGDHERLELPDIVLGHNVDPNRRVHVRPCPNPLVRSAAFAVLLVDDKYSGAMKLLHVWILCFIVRQHLVQIGRIDGPAEHLS